MSVLVKPQADKIDGILRPLDIIPQSAGWQYVAFAFYHLVRGQRFVERHMEGRPL